MSARIVAVPVVDGHLSPHFGHCRVFAFHELDAEGGGIARAWEADPPAHEPGSLPRWLAGEGVGVVIAGGMGRRAQDLLSEAGIEVVVGAPAAAPGDLVRAWLAGDLVGGANVCDH